MIRFNGIDFSEFNTFWDGSQLFDKPEKDVTFISVLGRNGDLTISNDRYKNLQIKVNCFIRTNFEENFSNLINFLTSVDGYARFESSEEPQTYRMATYVRAIQPKTTPFNKGGFFTLVFDCKPQRFLYEGEVPVSVENINSTRTGTLISIEDTENTTSITDAKAELEPKVYHDYDSVWLPGYGKNKLKTTATEETVNGLTFNPNDDGTIEVSGTSTEALTVSTDSEIYSKRVVENGYRLFDEIIGGSIVWNQLVQNGNFASVSPWAVNPVFGTLSVADNIGTITQASNNSSSALSQNVSVSGSFQQNHVLLAKWMIKPSKATKVRFQHSGVAQGLQERSVQANVWTEYASIVKITSTTAYFYAYYNTESALDEGDTIQFQKVQCCDLTSLFGNLTLADYIYNLEQSSSGSGIALFKKLFNEDYYAYNSGTIMSVSTSSHELTGVNLLDPSKISALGRITYNDGVWSGTASQWVGDMAVGWEGITYEENTSYRFRVHLTVGESSLARLRVYYTDGTYNYGSRVTTDSSGVSTVASNADKTVDYVRVEYGSGASGIIQVKEFTICREDVSQGDEYIPYVKNTYSLSPITLRGIPKLVDNKIVYDGDIYKSSGEVTRRYGEVDLGSLNWTYNSTYEFFGAYISDIVAEAVGNSTLLCSLYPFGGYNSSNVDMQALPDKQIYKRLNNEKNVRVKDSSYTDAVSFKTAMSGVKLIYELATPTTESTTPFTKPQICEQGGTEEYVDYEVSQGNRDVSIPVGHNTFYADYVVSDEAKLTEGETYNVSSNLTVGYRDSSGMHTVTNSLTIPSGGEYEFAAYTGSGASIEPMISTSSTTPFEPYENIGYLEEYSSATLMIEPKNIYPLENGMEYDSGMFIQTNEGEVRISGNATSRTVHALGDAVNVTNSYIASGGIAEGNSKLIVRKINTVMGHSTVTDYDIYTEDVTIPVSRLGTTTLQFFLDIANGSGDGLLFKPMLRNALITDSTFEKGVDGSTTELCLFDPAATGGEYSFYHRTLTETYKAIDISTLSWSIATTRGELTVFTATLPSTADVSVNVSNHYCTGMAVAYGLQSNAQEAKFTIYKSGNTQSSAVYLCYKTSEVPDVATLTSLIDGIYLNYKLYTPVTTNYGPEGAIYPIENATTYFYSPYQPSDLSSIVDYHELEISYTSPTVIENPTGMKAYPLIQIVPTDDTNGYVRINGATIFVKMNGVLNHGVYFFDTEIQDAYWGDFENANAWIYTLSPEIFFKEGKNVVTFENVDRVVIYPRWWKL